MKKKLVIWDLDGVIADSEKVWLKNRQKSLNEKFNLNWDFETINHYLAGQAFSRQLEVLAGLGIYPTVETIGIQAVLLIVGIITFVYYQSKQSATEATA